MSVVQDTKLTQQPKLPLPTQTEIYTKAADLYRIRRTTSAALNAAKEAVSNDTCIGDGWGTKNDAEL